MATSTTRLYQRKTEFWITGYFSQDKFLWFRVEVGDDEFEISSEKHHHGSRSSTGLEGDSLILEESVPSVDNLETFPSDSVTLDHFIYTVGCFNNINREEGYDIFPTRYIYCLDTSNLEKGWKRLDAEMKMDRLGPDLAELDGKIYIFGGGKHLQSEVYDPVTGKIDGLPVDKFTDDLSLFGVDRRFKRIIFDLDNASTFRNLDGTEFSYLVFFDPNKQEWKTEEIHKDVICHLRKTLSEQTHVVVGTTIYWLYMGYSIKAYDFVEKRFSFSRPLTFIANQRKPGWSMENRCICSFLVHMKGGDDDCFCIFWDAEEYTSEGSLVHCARLKISNSVTDGSFLSVTLLGMKTYTIRGRGFKVADVLPMDRKHDTPPPSPPPPHTITTSNATRVLEDVSTTMPTKKEKGLNIERTFVVGAIGIFAFYLGSLLRR